MYVICRTAGRGREHRGAGVGSAEYIVDSSFIAVVVVWTGQDGNARHVDGSDVVTWNPTISETAWGRRKPATVCRFNSKQSPPAATTLSTSNRRA